MVCLFLFLAFLQTFLDVLSFDDYSMLVGLGMIFHNHHMVWNNGDAAHVLSAMYTASIVSGEPRVDEESYELRFFGKDELPELFAEDHIAAMEAYFRGVRYPLLQENVFRG